VSAPRIGVLALQGAFREHILALRRLGADAVPLRSPEELDDLDGVVLPGGESTTMDKLLRKFGLQEPLRREIGDGLPVLATCAGLILVADAVLDGLPDQESLHVLPISVRRNAYGPQSESFEADVDVDFLEQPFRGVFIRSPAIEHADDSVVVHASVGGKVVMLGDGQVLGLTFHPELSGDDRIHEFWVTNYLRRWQSERGTTDAEGVS
jgi:5'-phosphate synthase pdxT subunit